MNTQYVDDKELAININHTTNHAYMKSNKSKMFMTINMQNYCARMLFTQYPNNMKYSYICAICYLIL